jgi:hypothetical protein
MMNQSVLQGAISLLALAAALGAPAAYAAGSEWQDDAWLKVSADGRGLRLAVSDDGVQWRSLDRVFIQPAPGLGAMRDPSLARGPDGLYRLVWSTGLKGGGVGYATSADLVNWSRQQLLAVPAAHGALAAPTVAYDEKAGNYLVAWSSGTGKARQTYVAATTDFLSFGKPRAARRGGAGPAVGGRQDGVLWAAPWFVKELESAGPGGSGVQPVPAPPPVLEGFTADPAIRVFGDTYYLYPTSDKPHWQTTDFSVWSSKNLVDWKKERMALDVVRDLKWGNIEAWAPDAVARNGKYYFYFCARHEIGVATADSPSGPFTDALGKPLLRKGSGIDSNTIDPYPFIDDDGQAYLYYGNGKLANVYKLNQDMVSVDGPPAAIALQDFREGIVVFKRAGKYYFMWSIDDARSPDSGSAGAWPIRRWDR